jgi:hypothetical protein
MLETPARAFLLGLFAWIACSSARADGKIDAERAREAYERGTAAYLRGDFSSAAREYSAADALVPNSTALQAALDAAIRADDAVLAADLLERTNRAPIGGELAQFAQKARVRFAGRTGRVRLSCGAPVCLATIDGVAVRASAPMYANVGPHTIAFQASGKVEQRIVDVKADEVVEIAVNAPTVGPAPPAALASAPPPRAEAPPKREGRSGLSPGWILAGTGVTALLGGITIASGVDTQNRHTDFQRTGCPSTYSPDCAHIASDGSSAQSRTNVLLGVTAAFAVATIALAIKAAF